VFGGFDVYEAFGEVIAPLVQDKPFFHDLTVGGGIRYSAYTLETGRSFNTTTWKIEGNWSPVEDLKLRGSFNRAVRAPNINELFAPLNTVLTNLANDPCASLNDAGTVIRPAPTGTLREICLVQGAPAGTLGSIPQPISGQAQSTGGGNINLNPEKSNSWTVGVVFQPTFLPGFSASLDYFNIRVTSAITQPTPGDAIRACFGANPQSPPAGAQNTQACQIIRRNPIDGGLSGDAATTKGLFLTTSNLGRIETDGLDLSMNYNTDLGFAKLGLSFNGTWTFSNRFQAISVPNAFNLPISVNRECVGFYSFNCNGFGGAIQPEFFWNQRTTLSFDNVDVSLLWRHISAVEFEPGAGNPYRGPTPSAPSTLPGAPAVGAFGNLNFGKIEAFDYFDLSTRIGLGENLTLTLTVANLFDKLAPIVGNTIGSTAQNSGNVYPSTYDALGRSYRVGVRLKF
jgi:iron complex outermembrane recepter protein